MLHMYAPSSFLEDEILTALVLQLYQIGLSELASCALPNSTVAPHACPSSHRVISGYRWKGYTVTKLRYAMPNIFLWYSKTYHYPKACFGEKL